MRLALEVPKIAGPFHEPTFRPELQGAHHPRLVADANGDLWVLKNLPPRGVLAEAIGALLGRQLGVPIREFGCFDDTRLGKGWLSSYATHSSHWHRRRLYDLSNFGDLGRMLVLDAIIYNEDRNAQNIIFEQGDEPDHFTFWAIDMEAALVSRPKELGSKGLKCPDPFALPPDLTANVHDESVEHAVTQARHLPEATLRALVSAAVLAAGARDSDALYEALLSRCRASEQIMKDYLDRLAARTA